MNAALNFYALWLADYYLLASLLLAGTVAATVVIKQPARTLAMVKSSIAGLALLAVLCALPGWSLIHLFTASQSRITDRPTIEATAPVSDSPSNNSASTEYQVRSTAPAIHDAAAESRNRIAPVTSETPAHSSTPLPWPTMLAIAHLLGTGSIMIWFAAGAVAAQRLGKAASVAPADLAAVFSDILERESIIPRPALLVSDRVEVAVALGIRRPAVILPADWAHAQTPDSLRTALAHELAHIRNHDLHWLTASRLLLIILWANPLFWLLRRRMRLDQETLADAAAAELTTRVDYAQQLVAWARTINPNPRPCLSAAVGLWETPSQLRRRIMLLLNEHFTVLRNCSAGWRLTAGVIAIGAAIALSTVTTQPSIRAEEQAQTVANEEPAKSAETWDDEKLAKEFPQCEPNTLSGLAIDEEGKPMPDVKVLLSRRNQFNLSLKQVGEKTTDKNGEFRFDHVVNVAKEFPDGKLPPDGVLPDDAEWVQWVVKSPGRVTHKGIVLPQYIARQGSVDLATLKPAVTLRGRVTDPDGKSVAGALVSYGLSELDQGEDAQSARTDADGNYTIDDLPAFDMDEFRKRQAERREEMEKQHGVHYAENIFFEPPPVLKIVHPKFAKKNVGPKRIPGTQDVQLDAAATIEGAVVFGDSGKPAIGARVVIGTMLQPMEVNSTADFYQQHTESTRADENGRFRFTSLPEAKYNLRAFLPDRVNEGAKGIAAAAGRTTQVFDLKLTQGGLVGIRLVDTANHEPIKLPSDATAWIGVQTLPSEQLGLLRMPERIAINGDGRFSIHVLPGESQILVQYVMVGSEEKWTGSTVTGEVPAKVTLAEGQSANLDVAAVDLETARTIGVQGVLIFNGSTALPPTEKARGENRPDKSDQPQPLLRQPPYGERSATKPPSGTQTAQQIAPLTDARTKTETVPLPIVVAKYVMLLDGKKIITWDDLEAKIAALPNPSAVYPEFYVTNGAREAKLQDGLKDRIWQLHQKFKLQGHSEGSLWPRADFRYDQIKDESDLKPDESRRVEGMVVDQQGKPVPGAEVILVTLVDESNPYKTIDIALVEGLLRNRLEEIVTDTDKQGRFVMYPPRITSSDETKPASYYVVAMHPAVGFCVSPNPFTDLEIPGKNWPILVPWAALVSVLGNEDGAKQTASIRSVMPEHDGYPELQITQYWSDLKRNDPTNAFGFTHVPPMMVTSISRDFEQPDGGSQGVTAASVNLLPGESRQIDLGPLSDKQREMLQFFREQSQKRLEEFRKGDGSGVMPAPLRATPVVQRTESDAKGEKKSSTAKPPALLSYGDGKPDGKKSYGGSGHMIRFELPEGVTKIRGIRIHGSRYGLPQPPDENFEITFLSDDLSETLHSEAAPYRLFTRGKEQWVRVMFDKEVELPTKFWIALNFHAAQTKGVYLSYDTSTKGEYSRVGLPGDKEEPKKTDFDGDWMVQVMLAATEK